MCPCFSGAGSVAPGDCGARVSTTVTPEAAAEDVIEVPFTVLPSTERRPSALFYTTVRQSWSCVKGEVSPPLNYMPHMGDADDASATSMLRAKELAEFECDTDGSAASDLDTSHRDRTYFSLRDRTVRKAPRAAVRAVINALGGEPDVLATLCKVLGEWGETESYVRHVIKMIERRASDHRHAHAAMEACDSRRADFERLTGGESVAVALGSGDVQEERSGIATAALLNARGSPSVSGAHRLEGWRENAASNGSLTASDADAAGLPRESRAWALHQAAHLWRCRADRDALRRNAAAVRAVHAGLRASGGAAVAASFPSTGILFSRDVADVNGDDDVNLVPDDVDVMLLRNTFIRHLCRVCLRNACRKHGSSADNPLAPRAVARLVILPPDPHVVARPFILPREPHVFEGDSPAAWCRPDVMTRGKASFLAGALGDDAAGREDPVPVDYCDDLPMEASSKEQDAFQSVSDAGQGPSGALSPTHDEVGLAYADVPVADSETVLRRDRYAHRLHNAIEIAARSCTDCRLSSCVRAAMRSGGPRTSEWTAAQESMLELGGYISGRHDTCRLARFVAGRTCYVSAGCGLH